MKTRQGHDLVALLKDAIEAAEILEKEGYEIEYDEGFVWKRRAKGEILFEIDIEDGGINVGDKRVIHGQEYEVTKIAQVQARSKGASLTVLLKKTE
ncbi:hypothetical protein PDENDC454_10510 [Paenibacillus dendritiformis C454]|uniref:Phage protein n=1 Tax=Paenibacillus dendritiformis C454 TaxID=1131935 RepID=H3SEZ7_9BACL|nr:hypothetical protein [Paenibacillus dendritiformis]EHQ62316.1 hypothetical protein PDENDC454_10510 [Paenibacillus dendritiformis C454]